MTITAAFDALHKEYSNLTLERIMNKPVIMHIPDELITEKFKGDTRLAVRRDTAGTLIEPGDVVAFPTGPKRLGYGIVLGYTKQGYRLWQFWRDVKGNYNLAYSLLAAPDVAVVKKVGYVHS
ncbi:hypothetical protein PS2_143 [Serratia phage PS2]|uniref:Uncharacterized protein n=1 Tax=Serratia phage PS2 TaxID=1481112 RepID=A0A023W4X6_9CAUD|nr:hypothetical protein FF83_gp272 [Serratia phage PS2]AHY25389.1 hypothetical protein PS2_143 [Serratia phage PS2]